MYRERERERERAKCEREYAQYLIIGGRSYKRIARAFTTNGAKRSICCVAAICCEATAYTRIRAARFIRAVRAALDFFPFLFSTFRSRFCPSRRARTDNAAITKMRQLIYSAGLPKVPRYRAGTFHRLSLRRIVAYSRVGIYQVDATRRAANQSRCVIARYESARASNRARRPIVCRTLYCARHRH